MKHISFAFVMTMIVLNTALASSQSVQKKDSYWYEVQAKTKKNHIPLTSYSEARHHLMQELHLKKDHRGYFIEDVYCNITYRKAVGPNKMPNHNELNVEHTWPQSRFNRNQNTSFQKADLHHLFPTDSRANGKRGHDNFGEFNSGRAALPHCPASHVGTINGTGKDGFEPPVNHKGNVARALFYFSIRYDIRISDYEEIVLRQWNWLDPVDNQELKRNNMIEQIQGNRNPFVDDPDLADIIADF